ncbi:MAG: hypothetical protein ABEJ06_02215 [Haloarculaceae archaeon]
MSKEDRYAHLGDGIETTTDDEATDADRTSDADGTNAVDGTIRVTIEDGDETVVLTVDPENASAEDIQKAVEAASSGDAGDEPRHSRTNDPRRLAVELSTLGPRLALKNIELFLVGLRSDRERC